MSYTPCMIGFLIKKAFFDGWDNLFSILFLNLGFLVSTAIGFLLGKIGVPDIISVVIPLALGSVWWATCLYAVKGISDFGGFHVRDTIGYLKQGLVPGLQFGAFLVIGFLVLSIGLPFYISQGGVVGPLAAGFVFWCGVVAVLALQYYLPLRARLGGGLRKNLRKSFLVFFDNPGFSIFMLLYSTVTLVISAILVFIVPGLAGVALQQQVALRLRLYKYDWLDEHPEANRRKIPWEALLEADSELVGKRTIRGMIFPWKE